MMIIFRGLVRGFGKLRRDGRQTLVALSLHPFECTIIRLVGEKLKGWERGGVDGEEPNSLVPIEWIINDCLILTALSIHLTTVEERFAANDSPHVFLSLGCTGGVCRLDNGRVGTTTGEQ